MEKKHKITQYRERLDRTLASPKLTNAESLKSLVKNQILQSSGQETEGCFSQRIMFQVDNQLGCLCLYIGITTNCETLLLHLPSIMTCLLLGSTGCSETVIEKRTAELSNFLDMLRSVSENSYEGSKTHDTASHPEWKVWYLLCISLLIFAFFLFNHSYNSDNVQSVPSFLNI